MQRELRSSSTNTFCSSGLEGKGGVTLCTEEIRLHYDLLHCKDEAEMITSLNKNSLTQLL